MTRTAKASHDPTTIGRAGNEHSASNGAGPTEKAPSAGAKTVDTRPKCHAEITVTTSTYVDVIEQVQQGALSKLDVLFEDDDGSSS